MYLQHGNRKYGVYVDLQRMKLRMLISNRESLEVNSSLLKYHRSQAKW
jgi:hypothetical protein